MRAVGRLASVVLRASTVGIAVAATVVSPARTERATGDEAPAGVEVTVSGVTASVRQYENAVAHITVRNPTAADVTVDDVDVLATEGLDVCPRRTDGSCAEKHDVPVTLQPGDAEVFSWRITVPDQVTPGKHPLLFDVDYTGAGGPLTATAASAIDTAAIGQTGGLDVLKVSFLFLPGFLALTVFYLLTSLVGTQPEWAKRLAPNNPEAWAVGVLLSFAAIPAYFALTGRTYLAGYAMKDLILVWAGSVGAGVALWVVYRTVRVLVRARIERYTANRTPAPDDSPATFFTKLTRKRWLWGGVPAYTHLRFPQVRVRHGGGVVQVFEVADVMAGSIAMCWVVPAVEVDRTALGERWRQFESAVADDNAAALAGVLASGGSVAQWVAAGALSGPELIPAGDVADDIRLRPRLIVQERSP